jgi:hypothetical protein
LREQAAGRSCACRVSSRFGGELKGSGAPAPA